MIAWLLLASAWAGTLPDVVRDLGDGVRVNWTRWRVEVVEGASDPSVAGDTGPLEQRAIRAVDGRIPAALERVPLKPGTRVGEEVEIDPRRARQTWWVAETRYHTSGRVEVVGAVDLRAELASWSTARSVVREGAVAQEPTGVVLDARGLGLSPCFAPELRDPAGEVLFDGALWRHEAWSAAPVTWVSDAAAPAAGVAGASPELFLASGAPQDCVIALDAADATRFRERLGEGDALRTGRVVIVVEP